jgi:hypothetical protein
MGGRPLNEVLDASQPQMERLERGCAVSALDAIALVLAIPFAAGGFYGYAIAYVGIFLVLVLWAFGRIQVARGRKNAPDTATPPLKPDSESDV